MAFVLDCSVTMAWIFSDEATEATDRVRDSLPLATLDRALEFAAAPVVGIEALTSNIQLDRWECGARRWILRRRMNSVYDAMYLELAVRLQLPAR